jgi:chromosomal replication initiator protein
MKPDEQNAYWKECLSDIEKILSSQQFETWVRPLLFHSLIVLGDKAELKLTAPNKFKQRWVKEQLESTIQKWMEVKLKCYTRLIINVAESKSSRVIEKTTQNNLIKIKKDTKPIYNTRLNADCTFESFVLGKANQLARAAAQQICDNPGSSYNPFFLYGGVGLGKTHLIHAIGNTILERNSSASIRYIHAEAYVSDVVKAYQRKAFEEFKKTYHSLDILLIDDIQFFAGKSRTQEEFFYAFEALIGAKNQIIITSDTYPSELGGIDNRLISRFGSGLTVAIEPPELEMRVAILLKKAERENLALTEESAFFIAKHLRSNVRELEGALQKIIAFCTFHNKPPSLEIVREALKDLLSLKRTAITIDVIQKTVAEFFKLKIGDMYSKRRPASIAVPRQIAMYLSKELTQKSLPEIGYAFGGRDHTTVLHAVRKIQSVRQTDSTLNHNIHILEQQLRS